jgi:hypothetical protein
MSEAAKEKTYSEAEIKARLQQELPRWIYEGGWIRRTYKTASWKGTLMVINTIGHLAEAAWHHPDLTASYAWSKSGSRIMPTRESPTRISIWRKKSRTSCFGSPERKAALWKARPRISVLRTSTIRKAKHLAGTTQSHLGDVLKIVGIEGRGEGSSPGSARRSSNARPGACP